MKTNKFFAIVLLLLCAVMLLFGCSSDNNTSNDNNVNTDSVGIAESTGSESANAGADQEWGVTEYVTSSRDYSDAKAVIKFPSSAGYREATGKIGHQNDNTIAILDAEHTITTIEVPNDDIGEVFPAYFKQTEFIIDEYQSVAYTNHQFEITDKVSLTVGDHDMVKYFGIYKCLNQKTDEELTLDFVAYATRMHSNNAFVYWMIIDAKDNSATDKLEEYADRMAESFYEND